jgi:hypothetical protein
MACPVVNNVVNNVVNKGIFAWPFDHAPAREITSHSAAEGTITAG